MRLRTISVSIAILALLTVLGGPAAAQEIFGSIQGAVTDDSGGIVSGVHITG
jgi:hypothetical protein